MAGLLALRKPSLLFVDTVVLLASSNRDLQLSVEQFAAEREVGRMRISTMVVNWKRVECPLLVGDKLLSQGRVGVEQEINRWMRSLSLGMWAPLVVKRERAKTKGKALSSLV